MCCDGLASPSNLGVSHLPSQQEYLTVPWKRHVFKISNNQIIKQNEGSGFLWAHVQMWRTRDSKAAFPVHATFSDAVVFGVSFCVKLYNTNLAVRKHVKGSPLTQAHLLTQTLAAQVVKSPHLCPINLKSGSGAAEGVETAHTQGVFAQALFP